MSAALAIYALLGAFSGLLIGCVGIGGVIVVPVLVHLFGVSVHAAIAAAMFAFLAAGLVGTTVFARRRSIRWDMTAWLAAGAMPAAFGGALAASAIEPAVLEAAIAVLAIVTGIRALLRGREDGSTGRVLPAPLLVAVGAGTGFASSLTGTGGPLVLVPLLVRLELPALVAIGLAQAIQLPIAAFATAANLVAGTLDPAAGAILGVGIAAGTWAGARLAHALPRVALTRIVAALLVAVGAAMLFALVAADRTGDSAHTGTARGADGRVVTHTP